MKNTEKIGRYGAAAVALLTVVSASAAVRGGQAGGGMSRGAMGGGMMKPAGGMMKPTGGGMMKPTGGMAPTGGMKPTGGMMGGGAMKPAGGMTPGMTPGTGRGPQMGAGMMPGTRRGPQMPGGNAGRVFPGRDPRGPVMASGWRGTDRVHIGGGERVIYGGNSFTAVDVVNPVYPVAPVYSDPVYQEPVYEAPVVVQAAPVVVGFGVRYGHVIHREVIVRHVR